MHTELYTLENNRCYIWTFYSYTYKLALCSVPFVPLWQCVQYKTINRTMSPSTIEQFTHTQQEDNFVNPLLCVKTTALSEHRPPPKQLITPIFPGVPIWRVSMVIQINPPKLINYSLYHCRALMKFSSKSAHNLLSNGHISD